MAAEEAPRDAARLAAYRKALDTALAAFPDDVELILKRGVAESPDASIPFFERALKTTPNHFAARHYLAHAYENGNRVTEALEAAKVLIAHPNPLVQAAGQVEAGFALLAMNRVADGGAASNAALRALKSSPGGQDLVFIALEALQGEFRLRTAQPEQGRKMMESAARKWRSQPGPDAWSQSLYRLESMARAARAVGDWELAGRMAQLMSEHDPAYFGSHYALAQVAQHAGNLPTARRDPGSGIRGPGSRPSYDVRA